MMEEVEIGFVAALEREVAGIVRGWSKSKVASNGVVWAVYRRGKCAVVCAGTGKVRGFFAAKALMEVCSPRMLISVGFAGACVDSLNAGATVVPATVVEASNGRKFECAFGSGQVVTLDRVAGKAEKQEAAGRFGVLAVDMEAAGVADAAAEQGVEFAAIKVISDGFDEELDFVADFVAPEGFRTGSFVAHIAVRPWLWRRVARLQSNSAAASKALASAVQSCIEDRQAFAARYSCRAQV